jgi:hypothetical protein
MIRARIDTTLHEAYLTGMLLFPEDFLPLGH